MPVYVINTLHLCQASHCFFMKEFTFAITIFNWSPWVVADFCTKYKTAAQLMLDDSVVITVAVLLVNINSSLTNM